MTGKKKKCALLSISMVMWDYSLPGAGGGGGGGGTPMGGGGGGTLGLIT